MNYFALGVVGILFFVVLFLLFILAYKMVAKDVARMEKEAAPIAPAIGIRKIILNKRRNVPLMLSDFGTEEMTRRGCLDDGKFCAPCFIKRDDPRFVSALEEYGEELTEGMSKLVIVEIPEDVQWELVENEGVERIEEIHRTWR
jgi:hypothetical protein